MPKTKRTKKVEDAEITQDIKPRKKLLDKTITDCFMKSIEDEMNLRKIMLDAKADAMMISINNFAQEKFLKFRSYNNITMSELKTMKISECSTISNATLKEMTFNAARSTRRSKSMTCRGTRNRSASRAPTTKTKTTRASRSLSRNKDKPNKKNALNTYTTPMNQNTTNNMFSLITPKVKPNTPQVILRRPKQGEIAVSMQGSPLMVGNVFSDERANINIPLEDGRIFSIQAERGLRRSQVPTINPHIKRQMEALKDNLEKLFQYSK